MTMLGYGFAAKQRSTLAKTIDGELGLPHRLERGRRVDGDDAHQGETMQDVVDEVSITMANFGKAPLKQGWMGSPRACRCEDGLDVRIS